MNKKASAIAADVADTTLAKLSASEFLASLQRENAVHLLRYWPEKKKYELELEPGALDGLRVGALVDILERIRNEKKKVEYEFDPWQRKQQVEVEIDPGSLVVDPVQQIGRQLDTIAQKLDRLAEVAVRR